MKKKGSRLDIFNSPEVTAGRLDDDDDDIFFDAVQDQTGDAAVLDEMFGRNASGASVVSLGSSPRFLSHSISASGMTRMPSVVGASSAPSELDMPGRPFLKREEKGGGGRRVAARMERDDTMHPS